MNEDAWENLDTWERSDHELIREYLNDAPVWFGERELKAGMNNYEMMGSEESNWKDSWIAPDGWKELSRTKTIMRGRHKASTMNLEDNGARLKRNSSTVFKIPRMTTRNTTMNCWDTLGWKLEKLNQRWKELERSWW